MSTTTLGVYVNLIQSKIIFNQISWGILRNYVLEPLHRAQINKNLELKVEKNRKKNKLIKNPAELALDEILVQLKKETPWTL